MKKYTLSALILSIFLLAFSTPVFVSAAQNTTPFCTDYALSNVSLELTSELSTADAGSTLQIRGVATNNASFPITQGSLLVKVYNGERMVDRFIVPLSISLGAGEHYAFSFPWKAASSLVSGTYDVTASFISAGKFMFANVALSNEKGAGSTSIKIIGRSIKEILRFDTEKIKTTGGSDSGAVIQIPVSSSFTTPTDIAVKWNIYAGSGLDEKSLVETGVSSATVPAQGSKTISYSVKDNTHAEYYAVIEAHYSDTKIIQVVPFTKQNKAISTIRFAGIRPNTDGTHTLFGCVSGSFISPERTLEVSMFDSKGQIFTQSFNLGTSSTLGFSETFTVRKVQGNIVLTSSVEDTKGSELDKVQVVYSCDTLGLCSANKTQTSENNMRLILPYGLVTLVALGGLILVLRRKKTTSISSK